MSIQTLTFLAACLVSFHPVCSWHASATLASQLALPAHFAPARSWHTDTSLLPISCLDF